MTVIVVSFFESVFADHSKDHPVAVAYSGDTLTEEPYTTLLDATIGNHVLSVVRMRSALNKSHQVRVHRLVERAERELPATISHKEIHALYLSATEQVCRNGLDKGGHRGARYRARPFAAGHWFASEKKTDLPDRTNVPITDPLRYELNAPRRPR